MTSLYPLRFQPIFRQYIWGGRRLEEMLGKPIGPDGQYAESWELVDHDQDQSIVVSGPLQGCSLQQLVKDFGEELLGRQHLQAINSDRLPPQLKNRFPLLFKFLDCNRNLSVQVHPDDQMGGRLDPPDLGKTEAWVVLHADPDAKIYSGLRADVDRKQMSELIQQGKTEESLHVIKPSVGDCVFIPAGTVHALGEGLIIGEIQQASDTTFRLFDWNRLDASGNSRPLHVEQSLEAIDFSRGPVDSQSPLLVSDDVVRLVDCEKFVMDRVELSASDTEAGRSSCMIPIGGDDRFHIVVVIAGSVSIKSEVPTFDLNKGETVLLPASLPPTELTCQGTAIILDIYLPASYH